jgi:hypothetical protein
MSACTNPKPTKRIFNSGTGPKAYCPGCKKFQPAHQVPWGQERRNELGHITASFAPREH